MRHPSAKVAAFLVASAVVCLASESLEHKLASELRGTTLRLRAPAAGEKVRFSSRGELLRGEIGTWTVDGALEVRSVDLTNKSLKLSCYRLLAFFLDGDPPPVGYFRDKGRKCQIEIELPHKSDEAAVRAAMLNVFLSTKDDISEFVPPFWKPFLQGRFPAVDALAPGSVIAGVQTLAGTPVYKLGGGVAPPRAISAPRPQYTALARRLRRTGVIALQCVVNEQGRMEQIMIKRPLGFGLDEAAVEAASSWRLQSAMRAGKPVAALSTMTVSFRVF